MNNEEKTEQEWIEVATKNGKEFVMILKDLEDKDYFPMFFNTEEDLNDFQHNIISEMKVKIVKVIKL